MASARRRCTSTGLAWLALALVAHGARGAETAAAHSALWETRFDLWVEEELARPEIEAAARNRPEQPAGRVVTVLDRVVHRQLLAEPERARLPDEALPRPSAVGATGESLEAARLFARGELEAALARLANEDLAEDAMAAHLRAQFRDRAHQSGTPRERLEVIDAYRHALRLERQGAIADRARLRIAQIYLEIGFFREAGAALELLDPAELDARLARATAISKAEAAYLNRDPDRALLGIRELAPETFTNAARRWAIRRSGDSLLALGRSRQAAMSYELLEREDPAGSGLEPGERLRLALAALESEQAALAHRVLGPLLADDPATPSRRLAGLLLARVSRLAGDRSGLVEAATAVVETAPDSDEAALALVELLEGVDSADLIPALRERAQGLARGPRVRDARALLAYRLARETQPDEPREAAALRLGQLHREIPDGPVRELVRDELDALVGDALARAFGPEGAAEELEPLALTLLRRYLGPHSLDEDDLLLAIEALRRSGDRLACGRWAALLRRREVRPIRRGLAVWREAECKIIDPQDGEAAAQLLEQADENAAGPFALALTARAAEHRLRLGDAAGARAIYERGLAVYQEPRLAGVLQLRLGQLYAEAGEDEPARRALLAGLARTGGETGAPPALRHHAIVTLARLADGKEPRARLHAALRAELPEAASWWQQAYRYLEHRLQQGEPPTGEDRFARAAQALAAAEKLSHRVETAIERVRQHELQAGESE